MKNYVIKATAADNKIRIFAADTTDMVEKARLAHGTSDVVTAALGRLLTAGALMGSMLKNNRDVLTLQIECEGPVKGLVVTSILKESGSEDEENSWEGVSVKGYAKNPYVELPINDKGKLDVSGALGRGFISVIKDMGLKEPFAGQTDLVSGEIAEDLTHYFANSEQVPSSVALGVLLNDDNSVKCSGGFIIQLLPFAGDEVIDKLEGKLKVLPPITKLLSSGMSPESILSELFSEWNLQITDRIPADFRCNCSKERVSRALQSISKGEILEMIEENKQIEVKCHFCNKNYTFSVEDLQSILTEKKQGRRELII